MNLNSHTAHFRNINVSSLLHFKVDASNAGAGNLEIIISVGSDNVPNFVKAEGNAKFEVSCTPQVPDTHMISVKFNGDAVPGNFIFGSTSDISVGRQISITNLYLRQKYLVRSMVK